MATLAVGGTTIFDGSALQSGVTGTIGTGIRFPQGMITNVYSSTLDSVSTQTIGSDFADVLSGSSVSYTPTIGARYVVYEMVFAVDCVDGRGIWGARIQLDGENKTEGEICGADYGGSTADNSNLTQAKVTIDLSTITTQFGGHSSHDWQTKQGGTSAFNAGTLRLVVAEYNDSHEVQFHRIENSGASNSISSKIPPTTIIYSVM